MNDQWIRELFQISDKIEDSKTSHQIRRIANLIDDHIEKIYIERTDKSNEAIGRLMELQSIQNKDLSEMAEDLLDIRLRRVAQKLMVHPHWGGSFEQTVELLSRRN